MRKESGSGPLGKLSVVTKLVGLEVAVPPPEVKLVGPGGWPSVGIGDGDGISVGIGDGGWPPGGNPPDGGPGD